MSIAVHTTLLVPTPYGMSSLTSLTTLATPQLSLVLDGTPTTSVMPLASHRPSSVLTVTVAGQLIVGAWLSTTMTLNAQAVVPQMLDAVHVTELVPTEKACGEVITVEPSLHSTAGAGLPEAVVENVTKAVH